MNILHLSAECYPFAKVGGLADVLGALPKSQNTKSDISSVVMPYYNLPTIHKYKYSTIFEGTISLGDLFFEYKILTLEKSPFGFQIYMVEIPELLYTDYVYSDDDSLRFLAFQVAALNWVKQFDILPNIVHCHDHHTGLTPFLMTKCYQYDNLKSIPTILTIHNAQYQGWFSHDKLYLFPEFNLKDVGLIDWDGVINPLAAGIKCAWRVTTVSPSYMEEMKCNANGLEMLLQHEQAKCMGILNGIDVDVWNPTTDNFLETNYDKKTVSKGKLGNKDWLCSKFNFNKERPLIAFIGRLVGEKGADLLPELVDKMNEFNFDCNVLILGSGNKHIEYELEQRTSSCHHFFNTFIGYDEALSHKIYGGADFLLMPSRVEPCGLNQLYALRYGTISIVRSIGGLKDTILDINYEKGVGICFENVDLSEMLYAIERAISLYKNEKEYNRIREYIMTINHSWENVATTYKNMYNSLK